MRIQGAGMELRVIVDGVERSISGITDNTTCAQIIYALAHATGRKGRFVLIEKFRNTERSLAPLDRPLEILRKWDTHSRYVSFMLKHLDESTLPITSDTKLVCADVQTENFQTEELPSSTMNCQASQVAAFSDQSNRRTLQRVNPHTEWVGNRPPPPAYHELIEQRYTSLSRENAPSTLLTPLQSTSSVPNPCANSDDESILTKQMSICALEDMIQSQKQIIEQQKAYLARLDFAIDDDQQREVIQLERQQENLRAVLNPLRECDWPTRLQYERIELQKITTSIGEFQQKLDTIANDIRLRTDEEYKLRRNIIELEEELKRLEDGTASVILPQINQ